MRPELKITFLGGAGSIGASSALVEVGETRLLIDCGVRFVPSQPLPDLTPLSDGHLDAILVTHAHSDHTGGLPVVSDAFAETPVWGTPPTVELIALLYRDALKIMAAEEQLPLYSHRQVEALTEKLVPIHHAESRTIRDVVVTYLPAAHILGASMIHLATPAGNILFTGDYSVSAQRTVPALARPSQHVDLVVTESTYGNRLHEDRKVAEERLLSRVASVLEDGGRVLIPAFAIGRAQEVILILKHGLQSGRLPKVPVFVDGMVRSVCDIYARHERYLTRSLSRQIRRGRHPFWSDDVQAVTKPSAREKVLESGPCVIVASSGMLSGGASVHYAKSMVGQPKDAILITGYQDEESPGGALLRLTDEQGPRTLKLGGEPFDVECQFDKYGLSAHADRMQIAGLLEGMRPRTVVLVHGNEDAKTELERSLACHDIVPAHDGTVVQRSYPKRSAKDSAPPLAVSLDEATARRLVGPHGDAPIRVAHLAEAYFGRRVPATDRGRLIERLLELDVVRRDDQNPHLVWVVGTPEELASEEQLKVENPKGKLLNYLMRASRPAPRIEETIMGKRKRLVEIILDDGMRSGPVTAVNRKVGEQQAARIVIGQLAARDAELKAVGVRDDEAETLRATNPKGRLLERFQAAGAPLPEFERHVLVEGIACRVVGLESSPWFCAPGLRVAEQAAAAYALEQGMAPASTPAVAVVQDGPEPRMRLNEMRQQGVVADFGYRQLEQRGPAHCPIFVMQGWLKLPGDEHERCTSPMEAPSKKVGERQAATALLELLG